MSKRDTEALVKAPQSRELARVARLDSNYTHTVFSLTATLRCG